MSGIIASLIGSSVPKKIKYITYKTRANSGGTVTTDLVSLDLKPNDMVLYAFAADTGTASITSSGWTSIQDATGDNPSYVLAYKIMGATPDTSVVGSSTTGNTVLVAVFRDTDTVGESAEASGATGDPDPPSITTTVDGSMIVAFGFIDDDVVTSFTVPTGFTTIGAASNSTGYPSILAAYYLQETAGTIDPTVMTNDGDDNWWAVSVALRPK